MKCSFQCYEQLLGYKDKKRIPKRVLQEQSTPNFPKNEHFVPPDTYTHASFFGKLEF